jgi:hypothetical protein
MPSRCATTPGSGWLGLDPTHNRATGPLYTRVAVGRDYADAALVRGTYQVRTQATLEVWVQMRELEGQQVPVAALSCLISAASPERYLHRMQPTIVVQHHAPV